MVLYQPQVDSWTDQAKIRFRAAIALTPAGGKQTDYGVVAVQARHAGGQRRAHRADDQHGRRRPLPQHAGRQGRAAQGDGEGPAAEAELPRHLARPGARLPAREAQGPQGRAELRPAADLLQRDSRHPGDLPRRAGVQADRGHEAHVRRQHQLDGHPGSRDVDVLPAGRRHVADGTRSDQGPVDGDDEPAGGVLQAAVGGQLGRGEEAHPRQVGAATAPRVFADDASRPS